MNYIGGQVLNAKKFCLTLVVLVVDTKFWHGQENVLKRRKSFALYDRWIWEDDRVPRSKILLTEGEEVDQIFWL